MDPATICQYRNSKPWTELGTTTIDDGSDTVSGVQLADIGLIGHMPFCHSQPHMTRHSESQ